MGFARPMLISTSGARLSFIIAVLLGPETKGTVLVADLEIGVGAQAD
jgi:hypothetical protein